MIHGVPHVFIPSITFRDTWKVIRFYGFWHNIHRTIPMVTPVVTISIISFTITTAILLVIMACIIPIPLPAVTRVLALIWWVRPTFFHASFITGSRATRTTICPHSETQGDIILFHVFHAITTIFSTPDKGWTSIPNKSPLQLLWLHSIVTSSANRQLHVVQ